MQDGYSDRRVDVPCGRCFNCRMEKAKEWAVRCMHEASLYEKNCFITLTYNDDCLPVNGSLNKKHFQLFMKRLRKRFGNDIRYYHCGEYGSKSQRPHYHACLFNFDFEDKEVVGSRLGNNIYSSKTLDRLWPYGFTSLGGVTFQSAAYVARYIMKKITGPDADSHYKGRIPEYTTMSRRPGIGSGFYDQFKDDIYNCDVVVLKDGIKVRPPKAYDRKFAIENPEEFEILKGKRQLNVKNCDDITKSEKRNPFKEKWFRNRTKTLRRVYEEKGLCDL